MENKKATRRLLCFIVTLTEAAALYHVDIIYKIYSFMSFYSIDCVWAPDRDPGDNLVCFST